MKHIIFVILFIFFYSFLSGQNDTIRLSGIFSKLEIRKTTLKDATKLLGKPDSINNGWQHARFLEGGCITTYYTSIVYNQFDCKLHFYSKDRNLKKKKKLSSIVINSRSSIILSDSVQTSKSDTSTVINTYGLPKYMWKSKKTNITYYSYERQKIAEEVWGIEMNFWFDSKGILIRIEID